MADRLVYTDLRVVTPEGVLESAEVTTEAGRIVSIEATAPASSVRRTLLPGFIDVHVHGGGGADTMDATPDALRSIARTHAAHGTTSLLATTMTQSRDAIAAALRNARAAVAAGPDFCADGARFLGIHLEGPYISPKKPGAQPVRFVRDYDPAEFDAWLADAEGTMRLITLAPEQPGANALIDACRAAGIVVSMGHTDATSAQTAAGLDAGVSHATHLFNQMPPIHHRAPGPIPTLLTDARARVEVIADGHHVAPDVIRMIVAAKGVHGVILITDAMAGAGKGDGLYDLGGNPVTVTDGRATLEDGTLAGSVLTMATAAANVRAWCGLDWNAVARLTSTNPAEQFGWTGKGRVTPGADADLVVVDDELTVHETVVAGRRVYAKV